MKFQGAAQIVNGAAMPDPVANPELVKPESVLGLPIRPSNGDRVSVLLLALEAPAAESVTVDVFVADEATLPGAGASDPDLATALAARRFYLIATGVALDGGEAVSITPALGGPVYLRRTADTLTVARTLRAGVA